jgi:hypothetical protein
MEIEVTGTAVVWLQPHLAEALPCSVEAMTDTHRYRLALASPTGVKPDSKINLLSASSG